MATVEQENSSSSGAQREFDPQRDVTDVLTPGGHVHGILTGTDDPLFRETLNSKQIDSSSSEQAKGR